MNNAAENIKVKVHNRHVELTEVIAPLGAVLDEKDYFVISIYNGSYIVKSNNLNVTETDL